MASGLEMLFARIQKECLPGIWSKGVALSRVSGSVRVDYQEKDEIVLRVQSGERAVSPKVTLWPDESDPPDAENADWHCDCGDRNEICMHVAAAVIALKSGQAQASAPAREGASEGKPGAMTASAAPRLAYRLSRKNGALAIERAVIHNLKQLELNESLVAFVGGISSGRIAMPALAATREDFAVDAVLGALPRGQLPDRAQMARALEALARVTSQVTLDGSPVRVSGRSTGITARLQDGPDAGFRLSGEMDPTISEVFSNGACLAQGGSDSPAGALLRPLRVPQLNPAEQAALAPGGRLFRKPEEIAILVSDILPSLEQKLPLTIQTERLPTPVHGQPKISLRLETDPDGGLLVVPSIAYPDKLAPDQILVPDPAAEAQVRRRLQSELHLRPGQPSRFRGEDAIDFALRLQDQLKAHADEWSIQGDGARRFGIAATLVPRLAATDSGGMSLSFEVPAGAGGGLGLGAGSGSGANAGAGSASADPMRVLQAWREGADYVALEGGGWAPLPHDWLKRYGARVAALLEARTHSAPGTPVPTRTHSLPPHLLPTLAELCEETGAALPDGLRKLRDRLGAQTGIPRADLPSDLRAELRDYQRAGVDWLVFLRESGMGALLADDMGLGKTLQAMCALRGRTLVVCPTSVLSAWQEQIARFRPSLRTAVFHGPGRALDPQADVTITTYAILRLDLETLTQERWDTLVIDEAQTIKNPSSQVAQAAHSLAIGAPGAFRIALSGTPVENRLSDLWSQFQFVNPGLLGSRQTFQQEFGSGIARGDPHATARLRARIKPFLLRRLKRDVAKELPPRTETVLHCELSESERELYDSLLAASRKEVLDKLEQGESVFAALELLLRLRQACCAPALVPGSLAFQPSSSKLALLRENLLESVDLGHRALVFSQWTSLLDLIEPVLKQTGIGFSRLDGTTRDREAVVSEFQREDGPSVLLISLKAGGTGLTLTAADHVYLMDPWWNPAVEDQAADRAHRIGQENPVLIQRLVARDTVEDKILRLQKKKQELAIAVLAGSSGEPGSDPQLTPQLTKEDLIELLA